MNCSTEGQEWTREPWARDGRMIVALGVIESSPRRGLVPLEICTTRRVEDAARIVARSSILPDDLTPAGAVETLATVNRAGLRNLKDYKAKNRDQLEYTLGVYLNTLRAALAPFEENR